MWRGSMSSTQLEILPCHQAAFKEAHLVTVSSLSCLGIFIIVVGYLLWRWCLNPVEVDDIGNASKIEDLKTLKSRHKTASTLLKLIENDGAGAWPPKANHNQWPKALQPYKEIYLELVPLLPTAEPSLDDSVNNERRDIFRSHLRKLLSERVNIPQVELLLAAAEDGNWKVFPRDAYNGFYACVAVCRHAYR